MSVLSHLEALASNSILRGTEQESIKRSVANLEVKLRHYFKGELDESFIFGSCDRETILPRRIDTDSDVDYMLVFKDRSLQPQTYLKKLRAFSEYFYQRSEIYQSHPTIALELNHIKFELVPAISAFWYGYQIPAKSSDYNDWITTDPKGFSSKLAGENGNHKFILKPLIRVLKYWNIVQGKTFESFELEQKVLGHTYFLTETSLKEYLFHVINSMDDGWGIPEKKAMAISKTKKIISEIRRLEREVSGVAAERLISEFLPKF